MIYKTDCLLKHVTGKHDTGRYIACCTDIFAKGGV